MDKDWRELLEIAEANEREWQRLIEDNAELQAELRKLRRRYHLMLTDDTLASWLDTESPDVQRQITLEIEELAEKYHIPQKWHSDFWRYAILCAPPLGSPAYSMGFPSIVWLSENGSVNPRFVVDSDTVLDNPHVRKYMRFFQRSWLLKEIPRPQPLENNRRKLDWRPVWEWHKKHPSVSLIQVAKALSYQPAYVRRKLAAIEAEMATETK